MKKLKRMLKLFAFICLLVLASFGIGLSGGVPIPPINKKKDPAEVTDEQVDEKQEEAELK
jgi:hypothetical protein